MNRDRRQKDVALVAQRLDVAGGACGVIQFLPEPAHQQIDRAVEGIGVATLRQVEQLVARQHALRMIEKHTQQAVFGAAQRHDRVVGFEQMTRAGVEAPLPEAENGRVVHWLHVGGSMRVRRNTARMRARSSRAWNGFDI